MDGAENLRFGSHGEPEDQDVKYGVLCIKKRESQSKLAKIRCSAPGPPPPPPVLLGAWSAMPGWMPGDRRFAP